MHSRRKWRIALLLCTNAVVWVMIMGCGASPLPRTGQQEVTDLQQQKLELINATSDELYRNVQGGQPEAAKVNLEQLSRQVTETHFEGVTTVEGVQAFTATIVSAKKVFNAIRYSERDGMLAAARIRLAADALNHKNSPMWLQYYKVLSEDVNRLESAFEQTDAAEFTASVGRFADDYGIIHPSIVISKEATLVGRMDSLLAFLTNAANEGGADPKSVTAAIAQIRQTLDELFGRQHTAAYLPATDPRQPLYWIAGIGSVIVAVLAFSAWRRYDYERRHGSVRKRPGRGA